MREKFVQHPLSATLYPLHQCSDCFTRAEKPSPIVIDSSTTPPWKLRNWQPESELDNQPVAQRITHQHAEG